MYIVDCIICFERLVIKLCLCVCGGGGVREADLHVQECNAFISTIKE